jgi:hypothetical protein
MNEFQRWVLAQASKAERSELEEILQYLRYQESLKKWRSM